jgi:hypothetical protein
MERSQPVSHFKLDRLTPLNNDHRLRLADTLSRIATELVRADAQRIQQGLGAAVDCYYPSTAGGGGGGTVYSNDSTPVEAKAARKDIPATEAAELLLRLHRLDWDARAVLVGLEARRTDRPIESYPECGHAKQRRPEGGFYKRCQLTMPDGRQCGAGELQCENPHCDKPNIPAGKQRRKSIALDLGGIEVAECDRCRKHRGRYQRSWGTVALGAGLVVSGEPFHA